MVPMQFESPLAPGIEDAVTPPGSTRRAPGRYSIPAIKPDFFIVGAPKCGTTAMTDYLAQHPEIFMGRKEMHFFGRDLAFASHFYRRAEKEYLAEFTAGKGRRRGNQCFQSIRAYPHSAA